MQYQKFVSQKAGLLEMERRAYMASRNKPDSLYHERNYNQLNKDLNAYRDNLIKTQPTSMMAALLKAMKEPQPVSYTHLDVYKRQLLGIR